MKPEPPVGPIVKACTRCGEVKSLTEFSPAKAGRLGRYAWCKRCTNERAKERRAEKLAEDPDGFRRRQREIVARHRARTGDATNLAYGKARRRAVTKLIRAHRRQFDALLALELDRERREEAS